MQSQDQPFACISRKNVAPGITVHVMAAGKALMQCWVSMKKGTVLPVHSHPHEQSSLIIRGRIVWTVDGREREGPPGSCVIFAPNQPHGLLVVEDCLIADAFTPVREDYLPEP